MNDINKAQCWCNRLYKLMKEKNYTQKSFLKEYKEKYGGGTQANISSRATADGGCRRR